MAFREDVDALHARIEALEKEREDARTALAGVEEITAERDRLQKRLDALAASKLEAAAKAEREARPSARERPGQPLERLLGRRPQAVMLTVLIALLLAGTAFWMFSSSGSTGPSGPKRGDTRAPSIGVVDLATTPDPVPIPFTVTGTDAAPGDCRGYLPSAPQLVLRTLSPMIVGMTTRCSVDLVAVLTGVPAGLLCDDDGGDGTNPQILTVVPAGETRLTIGTYSEGVEASCAIELHAVALPEGADARGLAGTGPPRLGTAALDGAPNVEEGYDGQIEGAIIQGNTIQSGCPGYYAPTPDLILDIREPTIARIDARPADGNLDLVLMIDDPAGQPTCDDDDGVGNAPRIAKRLAPGRYPVWIGTFDHAPVPVPFHVTVRLATIASEAQVVVPTLDLPAPAPVHVTGTSSDELDARSMWSDCASFVGYVPYEPNRTLRLGARKDVTISSGRDDLLVVVAPHERSSTVHAQCTTDAAWRGMLEPGNYDLFVGVATGESAPSAFDLTITTSVPSVLPYAP